MSLYIVLVTTNACDPSAYGPFDKLEDANAYRAKREGSFDEWTERHDGNAEVVYLLAPKG